MIRVTQRTVRRQLIAFISNLLSIPKLPCKNGTMEILNLVFVPRLTLAQLPPLAQLVKNLQ